MFFKFLPSAPIDFGSILAKKAVLLPVYISLATLTPLKEDILCWNCVWTESWLSRTIYILPFLFISKISQAMSKDEMQKMLQINWPWNLNKIRLKTDIQHMYKQWLKKSKAIQSTQTQHPNTIHSFISPWHVSVIWPPSGGEYKYIKVKCATE